MIELVLASAGVLLALAGVGFSLARRRDDDVAVLESSRRSRADSE